MITSNATPHDCEARDVLRLANVSQLASEFELSRPTVRSYLTLIERLFLVEFLPPWFSNRVKRLIKSPKLHFGDTGLACSLLRCSAAELDDQRELLGQLLETFVFGEIEKQASAHSERIGLHHGQICPFLPRRSRCNAALPSLPMAQNPERRRGWRLHRLLTGGMLFT
jgi:hypothetical protein